MLIVVEGCDGSGKSTLIDMLAARIEQQYPDEIIRKWHYGPPKRHPLEEYEYDLQGYVPYAGMTWLVDRLHWGEEIYGPIYRGGSKLGHAGARHVDMFLNAVGGLITYLHVSEAEVRRRLTKRGETFLKTEDVGRVMDDYLEQFRLSIANTMNFNGNVDKTDADDIIRYARMLERKAANLVGFPTYVGPRQPRLLLLGDKRNHPTEQQHRLAFVPYEGTSGRYLLEALPAQLLQFTGIANACEENCWTLWNTLDCPRVIALGRNAAKKLDKFGAIPYAEVPHPQFVRRFHHAQAKEYAVLIKRAATVGTGRYTLD